MMAYDLHVSINTNTKQHTHGGGGETLKESYSVYPFAKRRNLSFLAWNSAV